MVPVPALSRCLVAVGLVAALAATACITSPMGRQQLVLFPESEMATMGAAAFDKLKTDLPTSRDAARQRYVRCVADAITAQLRPGEGARSWEVTVFEDASANAFALPGGKIGVHTGLLQVARDQHQLATVIGHEVAHVVARHSNERVSNQFAAQTGLQLAGSIAGGSPQLMGLLGVGAQVGVLLPFDRAQESEADLLGLDLMARAGFDPRQSVPLWRNMEKAGGGAPPEFLSTHPSAGRRIQELSQRIPRVLPVYESARAAGRRPACS